MAATLYDELENNWSIDKRVFFAEETDIALSNPSDSFAFWTTSTDPAAPTIQVRRSNPSGPKSMRGVVIPAGTYLWLGGDGAAICVET